MTGEQANWLRQNKEYRALGQRPGLGARYVRIGMLHADGTFELHPRGRRPNVKPGSFEVGVLEVKPVAGVQTGVHQ